MLEKQPPSWGVFVYSERQTGYGTVRSEETVPAPSLEQAEKWAKEWASIPSELDGSEYVETTVIQLNIGPRAWTMNGGTRMAEGSDGNTFDRVCRAKGWERTLHKANKSGYCKRHRHLSPRQNFENNC